jgi:hypothetical protein
LVTTSMAMPPTHISVLRSATEAEEPITCSISWRPTRCGSSRRPSA